MLKVCRTLYGEQRLIPEEELLLRQSVYGIIKKNGKILLVNTKSTNKFWFPGGVIEKGETDREALLREIYEETGLTITKSSLFTEVESYFYYNPKNIAFHQYSKFFLCEVTEDIILDRTNADTEDEAENPQWILMSSLNKDNFQDYGFQILFL